MFSYKTVCGVQMCTFLNSGGMEKGTVTQNLLGLLATLPDTDFERWKKFQSECNGSVSLHCYLSVKLMPSMTMKGEISCFNP
jgi:hypothetical protein